MARKESYNLGRSFWLRNQRVATMQEVMIRHTPADSPHEGVREVMKNLWWKNWRLGEEDARADRELERQHLLAEAQAAGEDVAALVEGWG